MTLLDTATPLLAVGSRFERGVRPLVEKLRERKQAVAWSRGHDADYPTKWEPDALCQQAADEIETLRGERDVLVLLLLEADKVLSTVDDGESPG